MLRLSYDFTKIGVDNLTAAAYWVHGGRKSDPATKVPIFNEDEYDIDIQWRPQGWLKGFWLRARYVHVRQRNGKADTINDAWLDQHQLTGDIAIVTEGPSVRGLEVHNRMDIIDLKRGAEGS